MNHRRHPELILFSLILQRRPILSGRRAKEAPLPIRIVGASHVLLHVEMSTSDSMVVRHLIHERANKNDTPIPFRER